MNRQSLNNELYASTVQQNTRRQFLANCTTGMGAFWLAMQQSAFGSSGGLAQTPIAKAKRVSSILHMIGAPSQLELFDYKPELKKYDGKDCPQEYLEGNRFAFIQGVPKMLGPQYEFKSARRKRRLG